MPGPYTRPVTGDRANNGSATDATVLLGELIDGVEALEVGIFAVDDYGADPTGATDSTSAIEDAIDAYNASTVPTPVLYFPGSVYKMSGAPNPITRVGGHVVGRGGKGQWADPEAGGTRLLQTSKTSHTLTIGDVGTGVGGAGITVRGLGFHQSTFVPGDGAPPSASGALPTAGSAIRITGGDYGSWATNNIDVIDCGFAGFYRHIEHDKGLEVLIDRCFFLCEVENAIRTGNTDWPDAGHVRIERSMFQNYDAYSVPTSHIKWVSGGGLQVSGNRFVSGLTGSSGLNGDAKYAIEVDSRGSNVSGGVNITTDILVTGNHIESHGRSGGAGVIVRVANEAAAVTDLDRVIITDNHIHTFQSTTESHSGVEVTGSSLHKLSQLVVTGNTIKGGNSGGSSTGHAVKLTNVDNALVGNVWEAFASGLSQTGCTNVRTF